MHKGKVIAEKGKYKVIDCEICEFKHLDPIPSEEEMKKFYREKYYLEVKRRSCKEAKLINEGEKRETELRWLRETAYKNRVYYFELYTKIIPKTKRICDVGCGTGDFLKYMQEQGWIGVGIEPSESAFNKAKSLGLKSIYNMTFGEFAKENSNLRGYFDAINIMDVLHHVSNPKEILELCKDFLKTNGIICVEEPNEFNSLQVMAQKVLNKEMWWVIPPEHINYFNFQTLEGLLSKVGFELILRIADFPMELFLLMGEDYVGNPEVGNLCHRKRTSFELSIPDALRREIYQNIANIDLGRECIVFARNRQIGDYEE